MSYRYRSPKRAKSPLTDLLAELAATRNHINTINNDGLIQFQRTEHGIQYASAKVDSLKRKVASFSAQKAITKQADRKVTSTRCPYKKLKEEAATLEELLRRTSALPTYSMATRTSTLPPDYVHELPLNFPPPPYVSLPRVVRSSGARGTER